MSSYQRTQGFQVLGAVCTIALGLLGLYLRIDYSGWVLTVGLIWAVCS